MSTASAYFIFILFKYYPNSQGEKKNGAVVLIKLMPSCHFSAKQKQKNSQLFDMSRKTLSIVNLPKNILYRCNLLYSCVYDMV